MKRPMIQTVRRWSRGQENRVYSNWHRQFLGDWAAAIDIDLVPICPRCYEPLLLIEETHPKVGAKKPTRVIRWLAARARIPAVLLVTYRSEAKCNPKEPCTDAYCLHGIEAFDAYFKYRPDALTRQYGDRCIEFSPQGWADFLKALYNQHSKPGICDAL